MVRFRPHVVLRWYTYYHASTALTWSFGNDVSSCLSEMDHKSYRKTSRIPSSLVEPHNGLLNREAIHKDSNLPEIHAMSRHIWIRLTHALQCSQTHMGFFFLYRRQVFVAKLFKSKRHFSQTVCHIFEKHSIQLGNDIKNPERLRIIFFKSTI